MLKAIDNFMQKVFDRIADHLFAFLFFSGIAIGFLFGFGGGYLTAYLAR